MKERPILFSGSMVRALLAGQKTQTRRLVTPPPPTPEAVRAKAGIDYGWIAPSSSAQPWRVAGPVWAVRDLMGMEPHLTCNYGQPGDRLWVRETWCPRGNGYLPLEKVQRPFYAADTDNGKPPGWRWRPSIHMPRWASRLTLEVTEVRVQRLQEISEEDAKAEGIERSNDDRWPWRNYREGAPFVHARSSFASLWDSINGERANWDSNPWVWAVTFKRIDGKEGTMQRTG